MDFDTYSRFTSISSTHVERMKPTKTNHFIYDFCVILSKSKGGFPVMTETTRNHIFSKEISQVIITAMVLAPNFY